MNERLLLELSKRELEALEAMELRAVNDPWYFFEDFTDEPDEQEEAEQKR